MSVSNSHLAYTDCYELMDKALADEEGIRVQTADEKAATFFRMRCNQARAIDRRRNADTYPEDHPLCGGSQYDALVARIKQTATGWWVYIEHVGLELGKVEALSDVDEPVITTQRAIEGPKPPLLIEHIRRRAVE